MASNVFLVFPKFVHIWKVSKVQHEVSASILNFTGEVVEGVEGAFTNAIEMIMENNHKSMIAYEIGLVEDELT